MSSLPSLLAACLLWTAAAGAGRHPGMVKIPAGTFWMGSDAPHFEDARPVHRVALDGFSMARTEVTNAEFRRFVEATGHVTIAERTPRAEDYPRVETLAAGAGKPRLLELAFGSVVHQYHLPPAFPGEEFEFAQEP
jgi:formylglycine-generating enzyme required for sulfatase activity